MDEGEKTTRPLPLTSLETKQRLRDFVDKSVDNVNHPAHYTAGGIECIDAIQAALTPEEFRGFCKGNIMKYVYRERHKGGDESIRKAIWYANRMLEESNDD